MHHTSRGEDEIVTPGAINPVIDGSPDDWRQEDALPTLVQMLQAENRPVRLLLVELLSAIKGRAASAALARRALFDLSAEVREAAVWALNVRPRGSSASCCSMAFVIPGRRSPTMPPRRWSPWTTVRPFRY